jgi:hypothetical protein
VLDRDRVACEAGGTSGSSGSRVSSAAFRDRTCPTNVSVPVIGRDFWLFELDVHMPARTPIH